MAVLLSKALFGEDQPSNVRGFCAPDEIKRAITSSKNFGLDGSDPSTATLLLFFDTRIQRTWLAKTARRLYCILDDVRKPAPHVNWSMAVGEIIRDGELVLDISAHDLSATGESGRVDFGPRHKDWLYSTKLFTARPVEDEVRAFLRN